MPDSFQHEVKQAKWGREACSNRGTLQGRFVVFVNLLAGDPVVARRDATQIYQLCFRENNPLIIGCILL